MVVFVVICLFGIAAWLFQIMRIKKLSERELAERNVELNSTEDVEKAKLKLYFN